MKSHICALMLIGILGVTPLCYAQTEHANTSIEEVKKETQDLLQTIGSYTADQRDEAVQKAKQGLDRLDKRIDALEARGLQPLRRDNQRGFRVTLRSPATIAFPSSGIVA